MDSIRLKLTIAFDGGAYAGWQAQRTGVGVQQKIEAALGRLFPGVGPVQGSSRTDAGVHALGLVAHVDVPKAALQMPMRRIPMAINAHLPADIRVMAVVRAPATFHARFEARGKQYRYFIWNHTALNPLLRGRAWHVPRRLDFAAMRTAAAGLVGTHDFRSFTAKREGQLGCSVRTLNRCDVGRRGALFTFVIEGDGFLYRMCRGIVGTIVQAGLGKFGPEVVPAMLAARDRRAAGMTAPAHGLVLWKVLYGKRGVPADALDEDDDE